MSVEDWIQQLEDADATVRRGAATQLGDAGYEARAAEAALGTALADTDAEVRREAAIALGKVGPQTNAVINALGQALEDESPEVRRSAATALAYVGPEAVAMLTRALRDADDEVRAEAARAVGQGGPVAASAVPELMEALDPQRPRVVVAIAHALVEIRSDARRFLRPLLETARQAGDEDALRAVLDEVERLGPSAREAARTIAEASEADEELRSLARDLMGRFDVQAADEARRQPGLLARLFKRK